MEAKTERSCGLRHLDEPLSRKLHADDDVSTLVATLMEVLLLKMLVRCQPLSPSQQHAARIIHSLMSWQHTFPPALFHTISWLWLLQGSTLCQPDLP